MKVTAVFDIGKTNKKFFLFDRKHQEVWKEYVRFDEIEDEDGFPCDDLFAITRWMKGTIHNAMLNKQWEIEAINFSTYGASFVHLDQNGQTLTPLYNYLKPLPVNIRDTFYASFGNPNKLSLETASPALGMLNSGLQLYWLKQTRPDIHSQIRWSLHFPQYLSYIFTGIPISEYTSVGCHTMLWDYDSFDYHSWVYQEGLVSQLAPLVATNQYIGTHINGKSIKVGVGIHDSSSALLPYVLSDSKPFLLVSTGTWSISLNPFSDDALTTMDLDKDALNFMRVDGSPTKAARLFLGKEYSHQLQQLLKAYEVKKGFEKTVTFDEGLYSKLLEKSDVVFPLKYIQLSERRPKKNQWQQFPSFKEAYHQLMMELVDLQEEACRRAMGSTQIKKLYVDGGFANNELFILMLARRFPNVKMRTTNSPLGSALGASLAISQEEIGKKFLKKHYALKKVTEKGGGIKQ